MIKRPKKRNGLSIITQRLSKANTMSKFKFQSDKCIPLFPLNSEDTQETKNVWNKDKIFNLPQASTTEDLYQTPVKGFKQESKMEMTNDNMLKDIRQKTIELYK